MFGDLFGILGKQGPDVWFDTARSLAHNVAVGDATTVNPNPATRSRLEEFAPLVARYLESDFTIPVSHDFSAVTRTGLTEAALLQWRPLIEPSLPVAPAESGVSDDQASSMMNQLMGAIGPLFTGFQLGSVAGHFSERAWSLAVLPLPRITRERLVHIDNVETFASEWSLDLDTTLVFALAREFAASELLTQPGVSDALRVLLLDASREALASQGDIVGRLTSLDNPQDLMALMSNPEGLLDGITAPEDSSATRAINAAAAALRSVLDFVAFSITEQIVGSAPQLREAYRRYRRSDARGEDSAAALFGISTQGEHQDAAEEWTAAIVREHGLGSLTALFRVDGLPSYHELSQPEEWWQRVISSPLA
jgi:hypothetical protein